MVFLFGNKPPFPLNYIENHHAYRQMPPPDYESLFAIGNFHYYTAPQFCYVLAPPNLCRDLPKEFMDAIPKDVTPFTKLAESSLKAFLESDNDNEDTSSSLDEEEIQGCSCSSEEDDECESGYQSEFSAQCSTADGETDSRCSDPVNRNYSSVVANGSKLYADLSDSKEDTISLTEDDDCISVPEDISRMDVLSEHICDYYESCAQTERTLLKKLRLRDMLYYSLAPVFPLDQRNAAVQVLRIVEEVLSTLPVIIEQTLILAKVPILRIKFRGPFSDMVVDLNANNCVAVRNTHLLCYYAF
uniref:Uncharacterized protein n=1 Tax=Panagrolaimus sp. ES5 TaxID=591445 RepID=A0AC34FHB9_9BILA